MSDQDLFSSEYGGAVIAWTERAVPHLPFWIFLAVFLLLGALAWIRVAYGSLLQSFFESLGSYQVAARLFKDSNLLQKKLENILSAYYFLSMALLFYYLELRFNLSPYGISGIALYAFNLAFLVAVALLRILLLRVSGTMFAQQSLFREYLYNIQLFSKILGIILPPLMLLALYTSGLLNQLVFGLLLVLLLGFLILRLLRGMIFSFKKGLSKLYMILYLCALEMAPLVLLYRYLEGIL